MDEAAAAAGPPSAMCLPVGTVLQAPFLETGKALICLLADASDVHVTYRHGKFFVTDPESKLTQLWNLLFLDDALSVIVSPTRMRGGRGRKA